MGLGRLKTMDKKQRLTGVDLLRGIAVFAVASVHVGDPHNTSTTFWAQEFQSFCGFAVPFFLAASFYFAINKLYTSKSHYSLGLRAKRLLLPYAFWSLIYLLVRSVKFLILHQHDELNKLYADPIALVFFGGAAIPLYFLPLLFIGSSLIIVAEYLLKKQVKLIVIFSLFILSVILYQLNIVSGNSFQLLPHIAFQNFLPDGNKTPVVRILLVELSWIVRCMPYIFMAMLLNYCFLKIEVLQVKNQFMTVGSFVIFIIFNTVSQSFLPGAITEICIAYSSLLFALSISNFLKENIVIKNLGQCSFGIYLIHYVFVQVLVSVAGKIYPSFLEQKSILYILIFATPAFFLGWIATYFLSKKRWSAKLMFGA